MALTQAIGLQFVVAAGEITPDWRITSVVCMVPSVLGKEPIGSKILCTVKFRLVWPTLYFQRLV